MPVSPLLLLNDCQSVINLIYQDTSVVELLHSEVKVFLKMVAAQL